VRKVFAKKKEKANFQFPLLSNKCLKIVDIFSLEIWRKGILFDTMIIK